MYQGDQEVWKSSEPSLLSKRNFSVLMFCSLNFSKMQKLIRGFKSGVLRVKVFLSFPKASFNAGRGGSLSQNLIHGGGAKKINGMLKDEALKSHNYIPLPSKCARAMEAVQP